MSEHSIVLLVCLMVIVVLATLLYAAGWGYLAALAKVGELSAMLSQILAQKKTWTCRCASSAVRSTTPTSESAL